MRRPATAGWVAISANAYEYCSGDPINKTDFAGEDDYIGGSGEWSDIKDVRGTTEEQIIGFAVQVTCEALKGQDRFRPRSA
ncbi:hypothetical protein [Nonomuraea typhae]|uniref:Uncharacterized protein n=1 Tax=Nonomuraea typhae TaxID=2603600 RepID=A0ABW7Z6Q7_9ACTN